MSGFDLIQSQRSQAGGMSLQRALNLRLMFLVAPLTFD